jgi:hypothetical protein
VLLLNKTHEHWWEGANETSPSTVGMFPFNYVQPLMVVRAGVQLPAGEEITVSLPPELCPLADPSDPSSSVQEGYTLQVLLPHGADAGQEIEFPLPFDFDTSRIDSAAAAAAAGHSAGAGGAAGGGGGGAAGAQTAAAAAAAHKLGGGGGGGGVSGVTKGGNQVPAGVAPPVVQWRTETQRRRELEAEKAVMYKKIGGELSMALSAADAKSLVRAVITVSYTRMRAPLLSLSLSLSSLSLSITSSINAHAFATALRAPRGCSCC